jgi:hypothetical protein
VELSISSQKTGALKDADVLAEGSALRHRHPHQFSQLTLACRSTVEQNLDDREASM